MNAIQTTAPMPAVSLIFMMDSYKYSHPFAYPEGIDYMYAYGEARLPSDRTVVPFGMTILVKEYLSRQITIADVDAAEQFAKAHFGANIFARSAWEKVVNEYNGYLPIIFSAVPEGMPVTGGMPIYSVECADPDLFWMAAAFETMIQRAVWYPTTIATADYEVKQKMKHYYEMSGADLGMMDFALHDFGARGVTCSEQARIGGCAHLVNFKGSDTIEGILAAQYYYGVDGGMPGFSVYATEHSVECSFGPSADDALAYLRQQLKSAKTIGAGIISIVIDGYDVYRETDLICNELRQEIIDSGIKVVLRPDSGDMMEVVPIILAKLEKAFGYTMTGKGYRKINYVGVIQGDGVDSMAIDMLLGKLVVGLKYSADNVIFGSGGALLQKVNRDTLKFAQKASLICKGTDEIGIAKNPITDSGKKSKQGIWLSIIRDGVKMTVEENDILPGDRDLFEIYYDGAKHNVSLFFIGDSEDDAEWAPYFGNFPTLDEVRARCAV